MPEPMITVTTDEIATALRAHDPNLHELLVRRVAMNKMTSALADARLAMHADGTIQYLDTVTGAESAAAGDLPSEP